MQERLAKEKSKGSNSEELDRRAAELDLRERKLNAVAKLREKGLPDYLVDALNMSTDDDFDKSIEAILKMKGEQPNDRPEPGTVLLWKGNAIGEVSKDGSDHSRLRDAFGLR